MPIEAFVMLGLNVAERLIVMADRYAQRQVKNDRPGKAETILDRIRRLRKEIEDERP